MLLRFADHLQHNADVNCQDRDGNTPFIWAVFRGICSVMGWLLTFLTLTRLQNQC